MATFKIKVDFTYDFCEIDVRHIVLSALQKAYSGWGEVVYLNRYSFKYKLINDCSLKAVELGNDSIIFEVTYNDDIDEYFIQTNDINGYDSIETVMGYINECLNAVDHYSYRTIYQMDDWKLTRFNIKSITMM